LLKTVLRVTSVSVSLSNDEIGFFRWLGLFFSVATALDAIVVVVVVGIEGGIVSLFDVVYDVDVVVDVVVVAVVDDAVVVEVVVVADCVDKLLLLLFVMSGTSSIESGFFKYSLTVW
jgi:hypothetical protein